MFEEIYKNIISRLELSLPKGLFYHTADHTKYVVEKAGFLAEKESLKTAEKDLVLIAALYHDTGFLKGRDSHEEKSVEIAAGDLSLYGFSEAQKIRIYGMIMATKIPQNPSTLCEKIVADADLFYLGTENYKVVSKRLFSEMKFYDSELSEEKWLNIQQQFLSSHSYHTDYCRRVLAPIKRKNLESL